MRGLGILAGFRRDNSATVVILLGACRIDAAHHQPQPASLPDSPREKSEIVEHVFFNLSGHHRPGLAERLAVSPGVGGAPPRAAASGKPRGRSRGEAGGARKELKTRVRTFHFFFA